MKETHLDIGYRIDEKRPLLCSRYRVKQGGGVVAFSTAEDLSEEYTDTMQKRMGSASLTYRHEEGMNFHRIHDDLIVGSCLQSADDLDRIAGDEGVTTVLCLQEDSDMAYFDLDINPIRLRAKERSDVAHLRHAIRDFDPFSLRRRLPGAVALLVRRAEMNQNNVMYIHCTAGLGRAPAAALAYMWWYKGIPLKEAYDILTTIRPCKPKIEAIREAAVDLLYSREDPVPTTIRLLRRGTAQKVAVAGLDVGWGQSIPLSQDPKTGKLMVTRKLPAGNYQYKFIYDDSLWAPSLDHITVIDGGNLNNLLVVPDEDLGPEVAAARARIRSPDGDLTPEERLEIQAKLRGMTDIIGEEYSAPCDL